MSLGYEVPVVIEPRLKSGAIESIGARFKTLNTFTGDWTKRLNSGWNDFSKPIVSLASSIDGVVSRSVRVAAVGGAFGSIGAGAVLAKVGVADLNASLESTTISLGAIYSAKGAAHGIADGMAMAKDNIALMRKEAALLPGEFDDLKGIVTTTATPLLGSGMDPKDHIKLASKIMAAGVVMQMPLDQVAREAALLFSGHAGGQNMFGVKLLGLQGDKAEAFNKKGTVAQSAIVTKELDKYAGAIDVFGKSWDGLSSSFVSNVKEMGGLTTLPLFETIKKDLGSVNAWFDDNKPLVTSWANHFGEELVVAWDWGKAKALEWGPIVWNFAGELKTQLIDAYGRVKPILEDVAVIAKQAFGADAKQTVGLLISAGETWAKVKMVSTGFDIVKGGLGMAGGARAMYDQWEKFHRVGEIGKAAAARSAVSAGGSMLASIPKGYAWSSAVGGLVATGESTAIAATGAGASMFSPLIATVAAGAPLVVGLGAVATSAWLLYEAENHLQESAVSAAQSLMEGFKLMDGTFRNTEKAIGALTDAEQSAIQKTITFSDSLYATSAANHHAADGLAALAQSAWSAHEAMVRWARLDEQMSLAVRQEHETANLDRYGTRQAVDADRYLMTNGLIIANGWLQRNRDREPDRPNVKKDPTVNVQKVEIVVTTNADPGRVARLVKAELAGIGRGRRNLERR